MQLSKYFTLAMLTATSTGQANTPSSAIITKLQQGASLLDQLYDTIGPFRIESAFRSQATQDALRDGGNTQAVATSLHSTGEAFDIIPTTMTVGEYYFKIVANPVLASKFGAFAIKNTVIHLDTKTSTRQAVALKVQPDGQYVRLTTAEINEGLNKYANQIAAYLHENTNAVMGTVAFTAIGVIAIYFFFMRKDN